jgi:prepilin-type N-terminal cleavage/methylation domain-containing protein
MKTETETMRELLKKTRSGERGFSLIELMFALVALSLISLAAFTVISTSQRAAVTNDQTVQIQQNARIALDFISRDIRMTGYGNPATPNAVPIAGNCAGIINPVNSAVGPDSLSIVTVGQLIGKLTVPAPQGVANQITLSSVAGLSVNDVITLDGVFTASVNAINAGTRVVTLNANIQAPQQFGPRVPGDPPETQVVQLNCVRYTVVGNQLLRDGVPVADGIADLQLAYGVDANGDGRIDDQTGGVANTVDCLDLIPNALVQVVGMTNSAGCGGTGAVANPPADPSTIRLVRITVVGQATRQDPTWTSSSALLVEDRNIADNPGFRRRVLSRTVNLRNNS